MRRVAALFSWTLLALCHAGCQPAEPPADHLVLSGSRSMAPLMSDIAQRFSDRYPAIRINVESTPGDRSINDTRTGLADLGMLGRPLRPDETGLHAFPIARDSLVFIVHRSNPVRALSDEQIAGLFTRLYQSWKEVGGNDRPVTLAGQGEGRAAREVFLDHFGLQPGHVRADPTVSSSEQAIEAVAKHPSAIGYASLGAAARAEAKLPIRLLPLGKVPATLDNVRNGHYPLVRPLQLLTREPPRDHILEFLQFARSTEVYDLIDKHGFVPCPGGDSPR
jgi:phosphate transport system substrate-binding protein